MLTKDEKLFIQCIHIVLTIWAVALAIKTTSDSTFVLKLILFPMALVVPGFYIPVYYLLYIV